MPIYEYKCISCEEKFMIIKTADARDEDLPKCRYCDSDIKRVYSNVGVAFRGSGFYSTDK